MQPGEAFHKKAAFTVLAGRPSAGKSTLVNLLCGHKVAITSPVPQTTRNAIRGIVNRAEGQLVLVDTPGMHLSEKKFNRRLMDTTIQSAVDADIILYVMDASRAPGAEEEAVVAELTAIVDRSAATALAAKPPAKVTSAKTKEPGQTSRIPLLAAVNKMDLSGADFSRAAEFLKTKHTTDGSPLFDDNRIFPLSALKNEGIETLLAALYEAAPAGTPFYPEEYYTDQEMDFRIAEVIRGETLPYLREELPHAIYVDVADMEWRQTGKNRRLWVRAFIICERESQKGMIVGKGGAQIKAIGEASRKALNRIFDWKVELDLRVKTGKDWRHKDAVLRKVLTRL